MLKNLCQKELERIVDVKEDYPRYKPNEEIYPAAV